MVITKVKPSVFTKATWKDLQSTRLVRAGIKQLYHPASGGLLESEQVNPRFDAGKGVVSKFVNATNSAGEE
jgi:hypothetical protein